MSLIEWREEYCTGFKGVDFEHQSLIEQLNNLYALIEADTDRNLVIENLGEMYGSISAHFALEEQMMRRHQYDHYQQHQADHEKLLDEIRDITDEFENTLKLNDERLKKQLEDWFQLHFKTHDSRLHTMSTMRSHEAVSPTKLQSLIRNAKNKLLHRHDSGS